MRSALVGATRSVRSASTTTAAGARLSAAAVDHVFTAAPLGTATKLFRCLGKYFKAFFAHLDAFFDIPGLRRAANAQALAVAETLLVLVAFLIVVA